jgi:outer membrane receptor protein involved in Fe transport
MRIHPVARAFLALALSGGAASALAQQGSAELRGRVTDEQGAALPGAMIVIRHQQSGVFRQGATTTDGSYYLAGVLPGTYELTAELTGFKRVSRRDVRLEVGKTVTIDLSLAVGTMSEELTVTAESPIVDITSKEVGGHISDRELTDLPSVNRNYIGFIGLLPGVIPNISTESFGSDSVSVNGQDARNNNYLLDGGNNNDDVIGQRAGTQARTPLEAIQEFQVLTNQFDAEFGRTTGAVVNAITKSGTNSFHGSAFAFIQDASLTEKNYFVDKNDLEKPDTKFQQYGFTLGGPVIKDKAHFFVSVERVIEDLAQDIAIPARPDLNAAPVRETRVWNTLVRFDHQINKDHSWSVRWLRETSPQYNQIIPVGALPVTLEAAREEDDLDQTLALSVNSVLGNTRVNTLRFAFTQEDVSFATPGFNGNGRHQDQLPPMLQYRTYVDQQNTVAQARVNNGWQLEDTFSWFIPGAMGDHNLRFGFQYQYSTNKATTQDNWNGTFFHSGDTPFVAGNFSTYPERLQIRVPGESLQDMKAHYYGAFIQDKWQLNRRLTLSLGLRYDLERIPIQELDNPEFSSPDDYPVDGNNVAPRVGFAWDLKGDGQTVVRGGYGRFYDKTHYELITAVITAGVFSDSFIVNFPASGVDAGPSQGRAPTNPYLVNGPTVNRELLNAQFPPGTKVKNTGTVFLDSPDRVIPYTDQFTVGFERALWRNFSLGVDYVHASGRSQFMSLEKNPGVRVDTSRTGRIVRVDPSFTASVQQRLNPGEIDYDALMVGLERRWANNYRFRVSYTLGKSRGNTSGAGIPASNLQFLDDMNLDLNEGPTDVDRRHNLVVSGSVIVPGTGGLTVGTVVRYLSGLAFTVSDSTTDPDQNGILFDPLPAGSYSGPSANVDSITVDNAGGRNGAYGPGFFQWDMRLGYQLRIRGASRIELFGEVFNLTNEANFANPTGDRFSTNFLVLTALRPGGVPRTFQLGARFVF